MKRSDKRGQVTIFIIIGIVIVALAFLMYLYYPKIKSSLGIGLESPSAFIQECFEEEIADNLEILSLQGGSLNPQHYFIYNNQKLEYLCYTEENYKTCVMQQPMLKNHIESEIKESIRESVKSCFNSLVENYKSKGYGVEFKEKDYEIELLPKRVVATFNSSLVLTKESTEKYDLFSVVLNNNLYELVSVANSILNWETRYGDAETTNYMTYYHDLKVEKKKQSDGSTIYILTDRNNGNKFQFASRSVAWPAGYTGG